MNKYSVMIIDDSDTDRYLLKRLLGKSEIVSKVFEADNGKAALELFEDYVSSKEKYAVGFPPTILFLDINMPLLNGFEFLKAFSKLRGSHKDLEKCVIMMFSSSEHPEEEKKAFSYDFVKDFVIKGDLNPRNIKEKVVALIEKSSN